MFAVTVVSGLGARLGWPRAIILRHSLGRVPAGVEPMTSPVGHLTTVTGVDARRVIFSALLPINIRFMPDVPRLPTTM